MKAAGGGAPDAGAPFPWDEAMAFGLGRLRLPSEEFWAMTPRELAAAMKPFTPGRPSPAGRDALAQMMRDFPDGR